MAGKRPEPYPSDVTEEEWAFVLPYLLLCREDSPQRKHDLRTVFNAVRYVARTGGQWRFLPHEFGPAILKFIWPRDLCHPAKEVVIEFGLKKGWNSRKLTDRAIVYRVKVAGFSRI